MYELEAHAAHTKASVTSWNNFGKLSCLRPEGFFLPRWWSFKASKLLQEKSVVDDSHVSGLGGLINPFSVLAVAWTAVAYTIYFVLRCVIPTRNNTVSRVNTHTPHTHARIYLHAQYRALHVKTVLQPWKHQNISFFTPRQITIFSFDILSLKTHSMNINRTCILIFFFFWQCKSPMPS